jgi:hypothetical protein
MSKKNPTVAERAVRGVLGGWVFGEVTVNYSGMYTSGKDKGSVIGTAVIHVPAASVKKMLANERAEKAKKARRK